MNNQQNSKSNILRLIFITFVNLLFILIALLYIHAKIDQTFFKRYLMNFLYMNVIFHPNCCHPYKFQYLNSTNIYYYAALFTIPITIMSNKLLHLIFSHTHKYSLKAIVTAVAISALALNIILQQYTRTIYFGTLFKTLSNKTTHEKNTLVFKDRYLFPYECQQTIKGYHQGEFITDINFKSPKEMFTHRLLSYYLYPTVSTRLDNKSPKDIFILYKKQNPLEHIPMGYSVKCSFLNNRYLLVQKDEAE